MFNDRELEHKVVGIRRFLHHIPELDFDLPKTRSYLLYELEPLGFEIRDLGKAGFTAYYNNNSDDTLAFRSDMDALPITEPHGCEFRSIYEGVMHACGHDGHMAMLVGLASQIVTASEKMKTNCLLIFQAAEETTGGAKLICDTGILRDYGVSHTYGLHLWPGYPANAVLCRAGEFMAGTFVIEITATGRAAHVAEYFNGADALEASCTLVRRAYELEREIPSNVFRLLRFGEFNSGSANNIISDRTRITGVVRAYDDATFSFLFKGIENIIREIEADTGVCFSYTKSDGYPPVINPPKLYEATRFALTDAGFDWIEMEKPVLQAEDFSYYQHDVPSLFMLIGTGNEARLHTPEFTFDESILMTGVQLMWTLLTGEGKNG